MDSRNKAPAAIGVIRNTPRMQHAPASGRLSLGVGRKDLFGLLEVILQGGWMLQLRKLNWQLCSDCQLQQSSNEHHRAFPSEHRQATKVACSFGCVPGLQRSHVYQCLLALIPVVCRAVQTATIIVELCVCRLRHRWATQ